MRKVLIAIALIALLGAVAVAWLLADMNRIRPQAEAYLSARVGMAVEIRGDLGWRLLPVPLLTATSLAAADQSWRVRQASLRVMDGRIALQGLEFAALAFRDLAIKDLHATVAAGDGGLRIGLQAGEVLGGTGQADIALGAGTQPLTWTLDFQTQGLQGAALASWLGPRMRWAGAFDFGCQLRLGGGGSQLAAEVGAAQGASATAAGQPWIDLRKRLGDGDVGAILASGLSGECRLVGGAGRIDSPAVDGLFAAAARLAGDFRDVAGLALDYRELTGTWRISGTKHRIQADLDNLAVRAQGEYDYLADNLDLLVQLVIEKPPAEASHWSGRAVSAALLGLPVPVRCRGSIQSPRCGLDVGALAAQLADLARAEEGSREARQVEAIIDGIAPPKYRKAVASLLKLLAENHEEDGW